MRNSFKRLWAAALSAAFLADAVAFTGCGALPFAGASNTNSAQALTICVDEMDTSEANTVLQLSRSSHPNVEVETVCLPTAYRDNGGRATMIQNIRTQLMAGGGPDVFWVDTAIVLDAQTCQWGQNNLFGNFEKTAATGAFLNIKEVLPQETKETLIDPLQRFLEARDSVYSLPMGYLLAGTLVPDTTWKAYESCTAQKDFTVYFEEVGRSFAPEQMRNFAEILPLLPLIKNSGDSFDAAFDEEGEGTILVLQNRICNAQGLAIPMDHLSKRRSAWCAALLDGTAKFQAGTTWEASFLNTAQVLAGAGQECSFAPIPNDSGGVTALVASSLVINANTKHKGEIRDLIALMLSEKAQKAGWPDYGTALGFFPVVKGGLGTMLAGSNAHVMQRDPADFDLPQYPYAAVSQPAIDSFLAAEEQINNFVMPDDQVMQMYNLCAPYFAGTKNLAQVEYELKKQLVYYRDE
ncbi:MAG: extracellular solute-binding protein [Pygmaiobacter sp.]|nr:extracellular solute-binding protein [Pygmaiobacter sp.]